MKKIFCDRCSQDIGDDGFENVELYIESSRIIKGDYCKKCFDVIQESFVPVEKQQED